MTQSNPMGHPMRIAIVAGEESGDLLAADIIRSLISRTGQSIELIGVGGHHLQALGLRSLFDPAEIALMGFSAVVRDLPRLVARIRSTARTVADAAPHCLITVDSPDFTLRVARRVRAANPKIPIIHYVCPSVWAWRPGRAAAMAPYVDHILCLLPFEPAVLKDLGGPAGTFVGHRLTHEPGIVAAAAEQAKRQARAEGAKTLLLLPGSRKGEVGKLMEPFRTAVDILVARGNKLKLLLPTVPNVRKLVEQATADWATRPEVVTDAAGKWQAIGEADAALCASGTVTLELALANVPLVSCYKLDWLIRPFASFIPIWSASLPNLIADRAVVPEYYDSYVRPGHIARYAEALFTDTPLRRWQLDGFAEIRRRLHTDMPAGEIAVDVVLDEIGKRSGG